MGMLCSVLWGNVSGVVMILVMLSVGGNFCYFVDVVGLFDEVVMLSLFLLFDFVV